MINLKNANSVAIINPKIGASLVNLIIDGEQVSRETDQSNSDPLQLAGFPMVPYCNRIKDGKFDFLNHKIEIKKNYSGISHPLHGEGWIRKWDIESVESNRAILSFESEAGEWPWKYKAIIDYFLSNHALSVEIKVINLDKTPMPCGIGFHPYFIKSQNTKLETNVAAIWETDGDCLPTKLSAFDGDLLGHEDNTYIGFDNHLKFNIGKKLAKMDTSPNCVNLHIYAPNGQDFFCAEPTTHAPDSFNREISGRDIIMPGKSMTIWCEISVA